MPLKKIKVKVVSTREVGQGILELVLQDANQGLLPSFTPGAHLDVYLPNGLVRAYSLTNESPATGAKEYVVAVGLSADSRGGSKYIHESVCKGDDLEVGVPRNLFELSDDPSPALFIAGGIGITPLRAMVRQRQSQNLMWHLVYATRSNSHAAYFSELSNYGKAVDFHFDDEAGTPLPVEKVIARLTPQTHLYCCGPQALMQKVRELTKDHPASHLHFESFSSNVSHQSISEEFGFTVELSRQGKVFDVAAGQSIIDCLEVNGVVVPSVCREGICGACECTIVEGEVEHRDQILSEDEKKANQTMMICVSRAKGHRLILDL